MAYFRCSTGSASSGDGVALVVQCDANFAGSVITATNGTDTFTETCPSVSPYTVRFEGIPTGTYTISGIAQGQTFTTQFTVLDYETTLNATPEGATVLPINDIQIWLHCAEIWDKNYTAISQVLADTTTLLALVSSNNAVDYMVRSTGFATDVCANQTAMGYIGNNDYCADTLLADAIWCDAICNSDYFESVLNVKVPTMTSATTPSGTVSTVGTLYPQAQPYNLFDGITNNDQTAVGILPNSGGVIYDFGYEVLVKKFGAIYGVANILTNSMNFLLYGSNDGTSYTQIGTLAFNHSNASWQFVALPNSSTPYRYFKVMADGNNYSNRYAYATEYQFYGRA